MKKFSLGENEEISSCVERTFQPEDPVLRDVREGLTVGVKVR